MHPAWSSVKRYLMIFRLCSSAQSPPFASDQAIYSAVASLILLIVFLLCCTTFFFCQKKRQNKKTGAGDIYYAESGGMTSKIKSNWKWSFSAHVRRVFLDPQHKALLSDESIKVAKFRFFQSYAKSFSWTLMNSILCTTLQFILRLLFDQPKVPSVAILSVEMQVCVSITHFLNSYFMQQSEMSLNIDGWNFV